MKTYLPTFLKNICAIMCLIGSMNVYAANRNTIAAGNWSSVATWNNVGTNAVPTGDDNVVINHAVNLDANWGPQNSGSIIINAASSGAGTLNMSGGILEIHANVTLTGTGVNLNGGTIHIYSGYTLTIPGFNQANTNIIVDLGATLVVNGNYLNNQGNATVNGLITINGNYNGQAQNATVTGTGNITSTGSMTGINNSSIFGTPNPYCPSNCDGRNLFGGGNCNGVATAIPSVTSLCLGLTVSFTSTLVGGYNTQPLVYQWQLKNSSNVFVNITGATNATYSAAPSASTDYRVLIGDKLNSSDAYCYKTSPAVTVTVNNSCPNTWTGATSTAWNLGSNWSLGIVPTSTTSVIIPASVVSNRMPLISAASTTGALNNSGTITFTASGILNVYGSITNSGTITTVPGSTINMVGTTAQSINGLGSVYNLNINNLNGSGVSLSNALVLKGTMSLINGIFSTNEHFTIDFDAGGNITYNISDAGSINGNVSAVRNLVAKTHFISTPFVGVTSGQINLSTPIYRAANGMWLLTSKKYENQSWNFIKNYTTTLSPVSGYSLAMFDAATLTMTGSYTHGATYSSGDYINEIPASITKGMYFMMGNPYPSTLDWNAEAGWSKTNVNDAIYFWVPGTSNVASYVDGVGTNGGTQYIPAMQSFMVEVPGGGGISSLIVNNNARVLTNTPYFRTSSNQLVRLVVKNATGTSVDETVVRMDDVASESFDSGADAKKIAGSLSLYTKTIGDDIDYSINTLPITGAEKLIPLNLKVASSGLYTIQCSEYSIPGYSMILEDKRTQSYILMDNSTTYTINASNTDSTNRFVLRFVAGLTTGVSNGSSSNLQISTYDNQLMLNVAGLQTDNATIVVYDASGLEVMKLSDQKIGTGIQTVALPGLSGGVYIVKIQVNDTPYMGKVIIK